MKKTTWWLRIVGGFYLLLTAMNIWALFLGGMDLLASSLPAPMNAEPLAVRAFSDAWLVFVFELGVLGAMMLYASRDAAKSQVLVLTIIWAEVFRGIVADAVWIVRGYEASGYIGFIVIHALIIAAGVYCLRTERA